MTLYSSLDGTSNVIRVISILPEDSLAVLRCKLDTVSLRDFSPRYSEFGPSDSSARRKRPHLGRWIAASAAQDEAAGAIPSQIPSNELRRFRWGDYAALSYTWGDPKDQLPILINDEEVHVTKNLEAALRSLRTRSFFEGTFRLWVDAICINQRDDEERGSQIAMMRDIYDSSWTTTVWLGDSADDSHQAIELLKTLADYEVKGESPLLKDRLLAQPECLGDGKWLALQNFLLRPYWSRLWIVQEVALAPDDMLMICGGNDITWMQVQDGLTSIHTCHWFVKDACLQHDRRVVRVSQGLEGGDSPRWDAENLHHVDKDLARIARNEARGLEPLSFNELLYAAGSTHAYQTLDKVYGLLAIMNPAISAQIVPNYDLPAAHLFAHVAQLHISHTRSLDILREGTIWNATGTPSWAPDWTWPGRTRDRDTPVLAYSADRTTPASFFFSYSGQRLTCKAILLDAISGLGALESGAEAASDSTYAPATILPPASFHSAYLSHAATKRALQRCLVGDRGGWMASARVADSDPPYILRLPATAATAMPEFRRRAWTDLVVQGRRYRQWESWRQAHGGLALGGATLEGFFEEGEIGNGEEAQVGLWEAYSRWRNVVVARRFAVTGAGRFGWVPAHAEGGEEQVRLGDMFCVVFGCAWPLVVRLGEDGCYRILGEGYLQGVMEGEAVDAAERGEGIVQDVMFC